MPKTDGTRPAHGCGRKLNQREARPASSRWVFLLLSIPHCVCLSMFLFSFFFFSHSGPLLGNQLYYHVIQSKMAEEDTSGHISCSVVLMIISRNTSTNTIPKSSLLSCRLAQEGNEERTRNSIKEERQQSSQEPRKRKKENKQSGVHGERVPKERHVACVTFPWKQAADRDAGHVMVFLSSLLTTPNFLLQLPWHLRFNFVIKSHANRRGVFFVCTGC